MNTTYLIQRLKKPHQTKGNEDFKKLINSFSFGGGLKDGGMPDKTMKLINKIWRFDYMGSAEFEWGAVSESLSNIFQYCKKKEVSIGIIKLKKDIHFICQTGEEKEVIKVIKELYKKDYKYFLKESCHLKKSIEEKSDIQGWLELDNDFMFFIDKEMFDKTLSLFKIKGDKNEKNNFIDNGIGISSNNWLCQRVSRMSNNRMR